MQVREIADNDYMMIASWLAVRSWPMPVGKSTLPEIGYICESEGEAIAAAFVYTTNSNVVIMSWIVTPPHLEGQGRDGILEIAKFVKSSIPSQCAIVFETSSEPLSKFLQQRLGGSKVKTVHRTYLRGDE